MMKSVPSVTTGASPTENIADATAMPGAPNAVRCGIAANPTAATTRPPPMRRPGDTRRASVGVISEPTAKPSDQGRVHRPETSGVRPRTSCRYCSMMTYDPNAVRVASR